MRSEHIPGSELGHVCWWTELTRVGKTRFDVECLKAKRQKSRDSPSSGGGPQPSIQ